MVGVTELGYLGFGVSDMAAWRETRSWTTPRSTGDWPFPSFEASADEQWLLFFNFAFAINKIGS